MRQKRQAVISCAVGTALVLAGVFGLRPQINQAVSSWELMPAPFQDTTLETLGMTTALNPVTGNSRYYAWGVGRATGGTSYRGVAMTYNGTEWKGQKLENVSRLNDVASWRTDRGGSTGVVHQVLAVGEASLYDRSSTKYSQVYPSGNATAWQDCIPPASGTGCDPITFKVAPDPAGADASPPARHFNAVDFYDANTAVIVGNPHWAGPPGNEYPVVSCAIWLSNDEGQGLKKWRRPIGQPWCHEISDVRFARNFDVPLDTYGNRPRTELVWVAMARTNQVFFSANAGENWSQFGGTGFTCADGTCTTPDPGHPNIQYWKGTDAIFYNGRYHIWLVGNSIDMPPDTTPPISPPLGTADNTAFLRYASCEPADCANGNILFQSGASNLNALGLERASLNSVSATVDSYTHKLIVRVAYGRTGDQGGVIFTELDDDGVDGQNATWVKESVGAEQLPIYAVTQANPAQAFAGGAGATLAKLSTGNLTGWAWIGADACADVCPTDSPSCPATCVSPINTTRHKPLGWMNLNCANTRGCLGQDFSYGVTLKQKVEPTLHCDGEASKPVCRNDDDCLGVPPVPPNLISDCPDTISQCTGPEQPNDVGAFSGFGWVDSSDPEEILNGQKCRDNPASCRPLGYVSFERVGHCSNDPAKICKQDEDCGGAGNTCLGSAPPAAPFNAAAFTTACAKPINQNTPERYLMAAFDFSTDRVEGWGRFLDQTLYGQNLDWIHLRGSYQCGTAWCAEDRSRTCASDADCGADGPCDADPDPGGAPDPQACPVADYLSSPPENHYAQCNDCTTNENGPGKADDSLTCGICTHVRQNAVPAESWSCNKCGFTGGPFPANESKCGIGRCEPGPITMPGREYKPCLNDALCTGDDHDAEVKVACQPSGYCSNDGRICFEAGDCGGGSCLGLGSNTCDECAACSEYGVSLDQSTGNLLGYGFSDYFGFINFSFAFLYNKAWLQVLNGSIYSGSTIGSPGSGAPPGISQSAEVGPVTQCNATYLIQGVGTIWNYCSTYQTASPSTNVNASPYLRPGFSELDLPQQTNQFATTIGKLDLDKLIGNVNLNAPSWTNAYGQEVVNILWTGSSSFNGMMQEVAPPLSCLGNRIFYLTPSSHDGSTAETFTFDPPAPSGPPDDDYFQFQSCANGRGTFVIEGFNVKLTTNSGYAAGGIIDSVSKLASLGIIVIRDRANPNPPDVGIAIDRNVTDTVGNFFTDGEITVEGTKSSRERDVMYTNKGVMVASKFNFERRAQGTVDNPLPSEKIEDDGRLGLNPPPGFESFAAVLPQFQESRP